MNRSELAEIRARAQSGTPGPWPEDYVREAVRHIARNCDFIGSDTDEDFGWDRYNDADFIAHSKTDVVRLIETLERYRDALAATTNKSIWQAKWVSEPAAVMRARVLLSEWEAE